MAMVYTLVASAKEWLTEHYGQNGGDEQPEETEAEEEEVSLNLLFVNLLELSSLFFVGLVIVPKMYLFLDLRSLLIIIFLNPAVGFYLELVLDCLLY